MGQTADRLPISESAEEFEAKGLRKVEGASEDAKDLLRVIQPYKAGNGEALWRLHHLNRADKHRLIVTVAAAHHGVVVTMPSRAEAEQMAANLGVSMADIPRVDITLKPADRQFPLENDAEVFRVMKAARESQVGQDAQIGIDIALGQPEVVAGEPITPTLAQLTSATEAVIEMFATML